MGQDEVLKVLEKNRGWMIVGEIAEILHESRGQINNALRKLYKHGEIIKKPVGIRRGGTNLRKIKD